MFVKNLNLLAATFPQDDWGLVFSTVVTGLVVVFIILGLLIGAIAIMGALMGRERKTPAPKPVQSVTPPTITVPVAETAQIEAAASDSGEIIAAIAAAIAAIGAESGKSLRITGIKEKSKIFRSNWGRAGVIENTQPKG